MLKSDGTTQNYLYLHRDYQGTILAISGNGGTIKERRQFDAWGNLKKYYKNNVEVSPTTFNDVNFELLTDRGYTAHEHLFSVGLIHMNARLYDPVLHTFLSPDAFIVDPSNPEHYNRYAYALNNPLMYVDYTGNVLDPVTASIVTGLVIGAFIGAVSYIGINLYNGTALSWGGLAKSIIVGAVSGAASAGIGEIIKGFSVAICTAAPTLTQTQINLMLMIPQAAMHGIAQGIIQGISGGDAGQSFITAAISSIAAGGFGMTGNFGKSGVGTILFGTVAGGVTSHLQGGNFWEGAVIGLTVSLLNHAAHKMADDGDIDPPGKKKGATTKSSSSKIKTAFDDNIDALNNSMTGSGAYADALESYSHSNSKFIYKYGTKTASALELSRANKVFQLKVAKFASIGSKTIAGAGAVLSGYQYGSGQITGYEFSADLIMTGVGFLGPVGAGVSLTYFVGKAAWDYYNPNNTVFTKPKN